MAITLTDTIQITEWDMHRPCTFCGSAECDPDEMDGWITHLVTWHGYKVAEDVPAAANGEQPRTVRLQQVGWSPHAGFSANQRVTVRAGAFEREYAGRDGIVVGWNPSTSEFAVSFPAGKPTHGVLLPADLNEALGK
jgi:hypothetical protein